MFFGFDLSLNEWGEVASVALLEFRPSPVRACDLSAAMRLLTVALELVVIGVIAHGIIEGDLFADFDIAHCDETGWSAQARIGIATVIETVRRVAEERVVEEKFLFNLKDSF